MMQTRIYDYGMNGEGVAKIDGKIALISNALIGELIELEIVEDHNNYVVANAVKIIEKSENRTTPICPYYDKCGGCQLQHMNKNEQLKFKTLNVKKTLKKIANIEMDVNPTVCCSNMFSYRNKMSFSINDNSCGLKQSASDEIVDIISCPIASENINLIFNIFKSYLNETNHAEIRNLVIREIENQILIGVVTKQKIDLTRFYRLLSASFNKIGLYQIINTRNDSVVLSGKVIHVAGIKEIVINNFGLTYSVDLMGFHQTNIEIQNKLYEKVLNYIASDSIVINGFSGQGLLSAIISKKAKQVVGIEINKSSHLSAELLKKQNNILNLKNVCGDFHKEIKNLKIMANTLILDPTKKGCGKQVMQEIIGFENIIYISCNPIALSKDLNVIKDDYIIEEITPFDMFPNTTSVETFVKLKKK